VIESRDPKPTNDYYTNSILSQHERANRPISLINLTFFFNSMITFHHVLLNILHICLIRILSFEKKFFEVLETMAESRLTPPILIILISCQDPIINKFSSYELSPRLHGCKRVKGQSYELALFSLGIKNFQSIYRCSSCASFVSS
jgi:hypothetical protein